jgi:hypothetical protein
LDREYIRSLSPKVVNERRPEANTLPDVTFAVTPGWEHWIVGDRACGITAVLQFGGLMGQRGTGYGSEDHLLFYRASSEATTLDELILGAAHPPTNATIRWLYPADGALSGAAEPEGMDFLAHRGDVMSKWREFWPQRGTQPNWDGVARLEGGPKVDDWLLLEAKANHPEFCGAPCGASTRGGRPQIERALGEVKKYLGVHRHFSWLGSYYQHANRLACLYFLNVKVGIPARLIEIYFVGDVFPDGRRCPGSQDDWRELLRARDLTLGLPASHPLSDRVHEVFLPAVPTAARKNDAAPLQVQEEIERLDDASLPFLHRLRDSHILSTADWATITVWIHEARSFLAGPDETLETDSSGVPVINLNADPRNADWLRIVRVRRLTGHDIPGWAALWLWWLGHDRATAFWSRVAGAAQDAGLKKLPPAGIENRGDDTT